ncbi:peptidoglycan DD-metalloendopeptidase family protein [Fluviicola sp.]|jgi:septal ring factor EnvC (AmiA/AmiB activator)|uniref:murein hydrolase activator EnvC family protein n=1 Tax=Fluviicola sp. TaxID=1917219 RepID=UPI002823C7C6|nr:peptidoglycan DD-metalloendopeptidase family protein [Fluviicola sp.]MDR0801589.1 peptidoglycan DD-metalloendopeptidase family protein [Fluviicola sp.]
MISAVLKNSLLVLLLTVTGIAWSQKKSDQLQAEQNKLEKKLSTTKSLLDKVKKGTEISLNELKLIENQVKNRELLVRNFDNQIRSAELTISSKGEQIKELQKRLVQLKEQYKKLLIYAYKHRSKSAKMMYIFSSSNYFEAVKRTSYLKRLSEIQQKQFKVILQNEKTIHKEIKDIRAEKEHKKTLLQEKIIEKQQIEKDKSSKQQALDELRKDESSLMAELKEQERQKAELKRRIKLAIEKEIAEAETKAKKEAEKKSALAAKSSPSTASSPKTSTNTAAPAKEAVFTDTKENIALGKNFESNRGKLPWPVAKGSITENYGKNAHPTLPNVYTNNNGIDIGTPKNSQVRAVFDGEVTSVLNIPGAGKVIIIKHGAYRTVYSNLQEAYVSVGDKVDSKQAIGSLLSDDEGNLSTAHFEIHQVVDGTVQRINPTLWLSQ